MADSDRTYEYIVNTSSDFITLINKKYEYEVVNDAYCRVLARKREEILGHHVADIWGEERFKSKILQHLNKCFNGKDVHYIEEFGFGPEHRYMHVSYYPYRIAEEITHVLVFSHDISEMGEIEEKLHNYEYRDSVTGLFNRKSLDIVLDMELEKAARMEGENFRALIFLSVSNLQEINLNHGFDVGSMLLENTGIRIKEFLRQSDYVFRYDGQELAVFLSNLSGEADCAKVAEKLINKVSIPYRSEKFDIKLNCHAGLSLYPRDGKDSISLVESALKALGQSISTDSFFTIFDREFHLKAVDRLKLESDMHRAFEQNQFQLYYQPIVNPQGCIKGCETLIRWNHPDRGFVSPVEFIPIAEVNGLICSIGKWIIYRTVERLKEWCVPFDIYISINLTVREFASEELLPMLKHALELAGNVSPRHLRLEITESGGMEDPALTLRRMKELTDEGFLIYIDDFGTGHSSLSYLKDLPSHTLKIDKSFVDPIEEDEDSRSYLREILRLAENRRKETVVEGVETKGQVDILTDAGCTSFQGYYFSKPLPADDFGRLLASGADLPLTQ